MCFFDLPINQNLRTAVSSFSVTCEVATVEFFDSHIVFFFLLLLEWRRPSCVACLNILFERSISAIVVVDSNMRRLFHGGWWFVPFLDVGSFTDGDSCCFCFVQGRFLRFPLLWREKPVNGWDFKKGVITACVHEALLTSPSLLL